MQMINCLTTIIAGVHDYAKSVSQLFFFNYLFCSLKQPAQACSIAKFRHVSNVIVRHYQYMRGCLRIDISYDEVVVMLFHDLRRYLLGNYFAKNTVGVL